MKPYFRKQGKYKDNRIKVGIEFIENKKVRVITLPKPEVLLEKLYGLKLAKSQRRKVAGKSP